MKPTTPEHEARVWQSLVDKVQFFSLQAKEEARNLTNDVATSIEESKEIALRLDKKELNKATTVVTVFWHDNNIGKIIIRHPWWGYKIAATVSGRQYNKGQMATTQEEIETEWNKFEVWLVEILGFPIGSDYSPPARYESDAVFALERAYERAFERDMRGDRTWGDTPTLQ
jgi:hypothetical protein